MMPVHPTRRRLLQMLGGAGIAAGIAPGAALAQGDSRNPASPMPTPSRATPSGLQVRVIPSSGEALPVVGLGTWQVFDIEGDAAQLALAKQALARFAELGGTVVDSSPMYGSSESVLGTLAAELGLHQRLFLATKVWTRGRADGIAQMQESMRRMQSRLKSPLDLMQVHNLVDVKTHLATLRAWKREGRIRYLGITHYTSSAYAELERELKAGGIDFLQVNYSLAEREAGHRLLAAARDAGAAVLVNRPFAEGALFARVKGRALPAVAQEAGCASWAQFFLKWILARPEVTCVIPGTRNPAHVADNLALLTAPLPDAALAARMAAAFDA